jgi:hypothetical protein
VGWGARAAKDRFGTPDALYQGVQCDILGPVSPFKYRAILLE